MKLKKISIAILLASSGFAMAGTMGAIENIQNNKWEFAGKALYMQMSTEAAQANYNIGSSTQTFFPAGTGQGWNWGWELEAARHFDSGRDINLNWYHLKGNKTLNYGPGSIQTRWYVSGNPEEGPSYPYAKVNQISGSNANKWDMVNLELAQNLSINQNTWARLYLGVDYSRVGADSYAYINDNIIGLLITSNTNYNLNYNQNSTFNGFGPRTGVDLGYNMNCGFRFYGGGALGILAGTAKTFYNHTVEATNNPNQPLPFSGARYYNVAKVVAEIDGRLGATYSYQMSYGEISLDAGWMWVNYISALASQSAANGANGNNFGIQGLYFGAKWLGNFA
jgi:hypothetical protein